LHLEAPTIIQKHFPQHKEKLLCIVFGEATLSIQSVFVCNWSHSMPTEQYSCSLKRLDAAEVEVCAKCITLVFKS
jgi:hypothetical protein